MKQYTKSNQLLERAKKITPLGAQTFSKSYRYYPEGRAPMFIEKGKGCYVYDVDGNEFIDFSCALGPITVGYCDERVNKAVIEQLEKGIVFSQQTEVEVKLAEMITKIIPCAEMVRFVKNGGDATTAAVRLARAFTGKDIIAMCGYHGMHDWSIGASDNYKGVPASVRTNTKLFAYNDINSLINLFKDNNGQIAAVIMEPIQGNGPKENFLNEVKEIAHQNNALLIFDEVVSGFHYALGGASEMFNVVPDLAAFGKGMANGMPISAVAGKKEILRLIEDGVFISTTFGGEAISMAGAIKTLEILQEKGVFERINVLGQKLLDGINALINKYALSEVVMASGLAAHCGVLFEGTDKLNYLEINSIYQQEMLENGIIIVGLAFVNMSHTEKEIERYLFATEQAFIKISKAVKQGSLNGIYEGKAINPVFKRNIK